MLKLQGQGSRVQREGLWAKLALVLVVAALALMVNTGGTMAQVVIPVPEITSVSPDSGTTAGGESVTIAGINFLSVATVSFGGAAASVTARAFNPDSITVTTPPHAAGAVDVVVDNSGGSSDTRTDGFTYVAPPAQPGGPTPQILSVSPNSGTTAGGESVTITVIGSSVTNPALVTFGGVAASNIEVGATTMSRHHPAPRGRGSGRGGD